MHLTTMRTWKWLQIMIKKGGKKKTTIAKQPKPKPAMEKPFKTSTAKPPKPKPAKDKSTKATPLQKASKVGHAHVGGVRGVAISRMLLRANPRPLPNRRRTPTTEEASTRPYAQPQDDTSANIVCDSLSPADTETGVESDKTNSRGDIEILQITKELGEDVDKQARLDHGESSMALARPDPEPTHDEFMANLYPKVLESLKFLADEHVILEDPLSSTVTLSLIKNLEDAYTIGDPFINDKSTKDEPRKLNVEAEVISMVTVPIYQVSSLVPPLSIPVIDLSPPKPA
ncbi:hypothetical protein Tco_1526556 [Tanacetum coccineum]